MIILEKNEMEKIILIDVPTKIYMNFEIYLFIYLKILDLKM